jgi:hypothetical protein
MLCVQPLYFNQHRYFGLTGHKYRFFLFCMGFILAAAVLVLLAKLIGKQKLFSLKNFSVADWAVLGFALVTLVSALFSPFRAVADVWGGIAERHDGAITQLLYVAVFLIVAHWYKPRERDFGFFGISAAIIGLIGILQFYGMDFLRLWPWHDERFSEEFFTPYTIFFRSTLGNVNMVATYVCVAILLCGFLFIKVEPKWRAWRYVWLGGSASCFWLLILATSDSGMVGVIVTMILAVPFIVQNRETIGRFMILAASWAGVFTLQRLFYNSMVLEAETTGRIGLYTLMTLMLLAGGLFVLKKVKAEWAVKRRFGVIAMVVVIAAGVGVVEILGRQTGEEAIGRGRVTELREVLHGNIADEFGSHRVYIWRNAVKAVPENPIIGSGPDTFIYAFPAEAQGFYGQQYQNAHNEYLQILICQGFLGLLCYLLFLGSLFIKVIPKAFKNPLLMAVTAGFTGYIVQAFFNISLPIASQLLWVTAGILACLVREENKNISKNT